jgi:hypothetical protein
MFGMVVVGNKPNKICADVFHVMLPAATVLRVVGATSFLFVSIVSKSTWPTRCLCCCLQLRAFVLWVSPAIQGADASASPLPAVRQGVLRRMLKPAQDDATAIQVSGGPRCGVEVLAGGGGGLSLTNWGWHRLDTRGGHMTAALRIMKPWSRRCDVAEICYQCVAEGQGMLTIQLLMAALLLVGSLL